SVLSSRSIDEIAAAGDHEWHSNRSVKANIKAGAVAKFSAGGRKAVAQRKESKPTKEESAGKRAALPATLSPALATLVKTAPEGDDWIHEVKYDGYRMVSRVDTGKVRILSRNGKDWTARLAAIAAQ